jgi:hypothetical protein
MLKKLLFGKVFYQINRQLHLYVGVFLCPFLVVFAISTIVLNHPSPPDPDNPKFVKTTETVPLSIPALVTDNLATAQEKLTEAQAITGDSEEDKAAKQAANLAANTANNAAASALTEHALQELGLTGELMAFGPIRNNQKKISLMVPGRSTFITLDVAKEEAFFEYRDFDLLDTMVYLHRNPGPHKTKGVNWSGSKAWAWIADWTVYLTFFLTATGIYLWIVIKAERKVGLVLMGAGVVTFVGLSYAILASA